MRTLVAIAAPLYWYIARSYWGTMVRNGCPDRRVLNNYLRAVSAVNDLKGR